MGVKKIPIDKVKVPSPARRKIQALTRELKKASGYTWVEMGKVAGKVTDNFHADVNSGTAPTVKEAQKLLDAATISGGGQSAVADLALQLVNACEQAKAADDNKLRKSSAPSYKKMLEETQAMILRMGTPAEQHDDDARLEGYLDEIRFWRTKFNPTLIANAFNKKRFSWFSSNSRFEKKRIKFANSYLELEAQLMVPDEALFVYDGAKANYSDIDGQMSGELLVHVMPVVLQMACAKDKLTTDDMLSVFDICHYVMNSTTSKEIRERAFSQLVKVGTLAHKLGDKEIYAQSLCCGACYKINVKRKAEAEEKLVELDEYLTCNKDDIGEGVFHSTKFYSSMLRLKIIFEDSIADDREIRKILGCAKDSLHYYNKTNNIGTFKEPIDPIVIAILRVFEAKLIEFRRRAGDEDGAALVAEAERQLGKAMYGGCIVDRKTLEDIVKAMNQAQK